MKKRIILLDTHSIIHRGFHALGDLKTKSGFPTGGLFGLCSILFNLIEKLKPNYIIATKDLPDKNFRLEIFKDYKLGRKKTDESLIKQIKFIDNFFKAFSIPVFSYPGFEADDLLGTLAEFLKKNKDLEIIIASGDLDMLQLIEKNVFVYTFQKGLSNFSLYGPKEVLNRFGFEPKFLVDYKAIAGDKSDNIPGIMGIGDKGAKNLIDKFLTLEKIYQALEKDEESFLKMGFKKRTIDLLKKHKELAFISKDLATIRKDVKINFTLPIQEFSQSLNKNQIENLFSDLEFNRFSKKLNLLFNDEIKKENQVINPKEQELLIGLYLLNSTLTNPSIDDLYFYAKTKDLKLIENKIEKDIKQQGLDFVFEKIEKPLTPVILKMKQRGILINKKLLNQISLEINKKLKLQEKKIYKLVGSEFNIRSSKQLGEILFENLKLGQGKIKKTSSGQYSTRESELEKLKDLHPIIIEILLFKRLQKINSTYVDGFKKFIDSDGRIRSNFLQTGTTTGRLASQGPNLQNIPASGLYADEVKSLFIPSNNDFCFLSFDYSQIELKIAAALSKDKKLIKIFQNNLDIHASVAQKIFNLDSNQDVSKELRQRAKIINFGILYGMGAQSLRAGLNNSINLIEAKDFIQKYFEQFTELHAFLENSKVIVKKEGSIRTFFGRRRILKEIFSPLPFIRSQAERMALNAPIQGTQADIIKLAMIEIDKFLVNKNLNNDCFCLIQIHDELIFEIKKDLILEIAPEIKKIMENIIQPKDFQGVSINVNSYSGSNWSTLKKLKL